MQENKDLIARANYNNIWYVLYGKEKALWVFKYRKFVDNSMLYI